MKRIAVILMLIGMVAFLLSAFTKALDVADMPTLLYGGPVAYAVGIFMLLRDKAKEQV